MRQKMEQGAVAMPEDQGKIYAECLKKIKDFYSFEMQTMGIGEEKRVLSQFDPVLLHKCKIEATKDLTDKPLFQLTLRR